jgi:hypothetical protein
LKQHKATLLLFSFAGPMLSPWQWVFLSFAYQGKVMGKKPVSCFYLRLIVAKTQKHDMRAHSRIELWFTFTKHVNNNYGRLRYDLTQLSSKKYLKNVKNWLHTIITFTAQLKTKQTMRWG